MSFLNSVLSAIGNDQAPKSSLKSQPSSSAARNNGDGGGASQLQNATSKPALKRKLDTEQSANVAKSLRTEAPLVNSKFSGNIVAPYITSSSKPTNPQAPSQMNRKPLIAVVQENPTSMPEAAQPPRKGSYKEIMARAQAAKAAQAPIGQIKHKPIIKTSRKERLALEAEMAQKAKLGAKAGKSKGTRAELSDPGSKEESKNPGDVGYKGTMRPPQENAYKGTMRPSGNSVQSRHGSSRDKEKRPGLGDGSSRGYTYVSYSDEEDDDQEIDEEYASDESDDMEGGGFDELEREEEESLRAAKKEDEAARNEEEAHHRQKAERKEKLMQLAAAAKAKKK